jgi:two-component system, OmpR family, alkaline phosphatase synthesis response regulator PhoP
MPAAVESRPTILLVEPERVLRDLMVLALERSGFSIVLAEQPETTVAMIRAHHPFLVLLDLFLPHGSGWEILKQIDASLRARCWVFALSAFGFPEVVQQAKQAGARDFILKPIDIDSLVEKVIQAHAESRFLQPWD